MTNIPKDITGTLIHPMLQTLPEWLKHPRSFKQVEKMLIETIRACKKDHSDPLEMMNCKTCSENMLKRRALMKKLGFSSVEQYMEWRKIHTEIKKRVPFDKYNSIVNGTD